MSRASRRRPRDPEGPPSQSQLDEVAKLLRQLGRDPNVKVGPTWADARTHVRQLRTELRASSRAETVARYEGLRYSERQARDTAAQAVEHAGRLLPAAVLGLGRATDALLDRVQRQRRTIVLQTGALESIIDAYEAEYGPVGEERWLTEPGMASPSDDFRACVDVARDVLRRCEDDLKGER